MSEDAGRRICAEIKEGRDCPVHGKVHGPTGIYTPPDWEGLVDDAVHEVNQRWGEPVGDGEMVDVDQQIVREMVEAILRPVVAERDTAQAKLDEVSQERDRLLRALGQIAGEWHARRLPDGERFGCSCPEFASETLDAALAQSQGVPVQGGGEER